ncbi:hypothetical protein UVI_02023960 [Ustilaginoidea virens]|uniref:Uncharacterized protein n=1 Tax=Ustilaginoidea virens TaxID=1159556 RepID=A0A1B5KZF9_USTVR|nr:hypothetical protein UVI_02023960 [Ustilaginoidea virens]
MRGARRKHCPKVATSLEWAGPVQCGTCALGLWLVGPGKLCQSCRGLEPELGPNRLAACDRACRRGTHAHVAFVLRGLCRAHPWQRLDSPAGAKRGVQFCWGGDSQLGPRRLIVAKPLRLVGNLVDFVMCFFLETTALNLACLRTPYLVVGLLPATSWKEAPFRELQRNLGGCSRTKEWLSG